MTQTLLRLSLLTLIGLISLTVLSIGYQPVRAAEPGLVTNPRSVQFVGVTRIQDILRILAKGAKWLLALVWAIAVIMIIHAGLIWMTAGGDEDALNRAKDKLTQALVGAAIALLAAGLVYIIQQLLSY